MSQKAKLFFSDANPALLLVDIQSDYGQLVTPQFEKEVKGVIKKARIENIPIIHVRYVACRKKSNHLPYKFQISNGKQTHKTYKRHGKIHMWTKKSGDSVTTKYTFDAFLGTRLNAMLRNRNIKTVYIAGLETGVCVLNTVFSAFNRGYRVRVVEAACIDSNKKRHADTFVNYKNELYLPAAN